MFCGVRGNTIINGAYVHCTNVKYDNTLESSSILGFLRALVCTRYNVSVHVVCNISYR